MRTTPAVIDRLAMPSAKRSNFITPSLSRIRRDWLQRRTDTAQSAMGTYSMGDQHLPQTVLGIWLHVGNHAIVVPGDRIPADIVGDELIHVEGSGYAVANFKTGQYYTSAVATWQVPAVTYGYTTDTSGWEYSSTWVGIGGFCEAENPQGTNCTLVDGTLIQLGTSSEVPAGGGAYYWAWYEMLPAGSYAITVGNSNPVNAGDI